MKQTISFLLLSTTALAAVLACYLIFFTPLPVFLAMQADSVAHAGTWVDDPGNWKRAFGEDAPGQIKIVHSKYWRSNHFTYECAYYFEIDGSPEWKDEFLKIRQLSPVPSSEARSFRTNDHSDMSPKWFTPDPVDLYEVWDREGRFGSVWINKSNGHLFFYGIRV